MLKPIKERPHPFQYFIFVWLGPCLAVALPLAAFLIGWLTHHPLTWQLACAALSGIGMGMVVWPEIPQTLYESTHFPLGMIFDHDTELWWYQAAGATLIMLAIFVGWKAW
jgi:hypothetical protein